MPEITAVGWLHTAMGVIALVSGAVTLTSFREITPQTRSGQVYLLTTLVTAGTALVIFQRGTFGPGHALALMTMLALAVGMVAAKTNLFGAVSRYLQALAFSATLLFHSVPAVTDGLMRLPPGDPVLSSFDDPLLKKCYLGLLLAFVIGVSLQLRWIHRQSGQGDTRS